MDVNELLKKYGIPLEDVMKWGKEHYPSFALNAKALAILYLKQTKGISVLGEESGASFGVQQRIPTIRNFSEAELGNRYQIKGLLLDKIEEWTYKSCFKCGKAIPRGADRCAVCNVEGKQKFGKRYLFANEEGTFSVIVFDTENRELDSGEYLLMGKVSELRRGAGERALVMLSIQKMEGIDKVKAQKLNTWFVINPRSKITDLQEFIKNEKIGMTIEEVCQKFGCKIDGEYIVKEVK